MTVALAIMCKTPRAGASKTRLSPPLSDIQCAEISGCFICDLGLTLASMSRDLDTSPVAVYTPEGSEHDLLKLLPPGFGLTLQSDGDFGVRLRRGIDDLLAAGHDGAILINSDSPTLPKEILRRAVEELRRGDNLVLSPASDGGYTLIGLSRPHPRLFEDIAWSTSTVLASTLERAAEIGLDVRLVPGWYDVDDAASLRTLIDELGGRSPGFAGIQGAAAPATAGFLKQNRFLQDDVKRIPDDIVDLKRVSVVIPCLNEEAPIAGVIRDVLTQGVARVIVVDNGSSDRTAEVAASAGALVVGEPRRGYGRACAAGVSALPPDAEVVCFLDGDGSDVASFIPAIVAPVLQDTADFVMGSRITGRREKGSMTPQQIVAGRIAGLLLRWCYGVRFTDMSPFRSMRLKTLSQLGMCEETYGWNLEMQMRAAASGLRIMEMPVDHRCRTGGVSKVSGNLVAGISAAWKITAVFVRLFVALRRYPHTLPQHSSRERQV